MGNPYSPPSQITRQKSKFPTLRMAWILAALYGNVALNYATNLNDATNLNLSIWDSFSFIHFVFLVAPIATAVHLTYLIGKEKDASVFASKSLFIPMIVIPVTFALPWSLLYSNNPFEYYVLTNHYFGPYGWTLWFWLVAIGLLPMVSRVSYVRKSKFPLAMLSCIGVVAHCHNTYWVWAICHR